MAPDAYRILKGNLSLARRVLARGQAGLWLMRALTFAALILIVSTGAVMIVGTESTLTPVFGFLAVFGIPLLVIASLAVALLRVPSTERVAVMTDGLAPGKKNTVISSLQLGKRASELSGLYSRAVIDAIVRDGASLSASLEFKKLLPLEKLRFWSTSLVVSTAALSAMLVFVPGALNPSFSSLLSSPFVERVSLSVEPGDAEVDSGEDVRVEVVVTGSLSEPRLRVTTGARPQFYVDMSRSNDSGAFETTLERVETRTQYSAELGRVESPTYTISVRPPPQVSEFLIAYRYPEYTGAEGRVVGTVVGDVSALIGSRVSLGVKFNRPVSSAALLFDDGKTVSMNRRSDTDFSGGFTLLREGTYQVSATDKVGKQHLSAPYSVDYQEDFSPFLKVVFPLPEADIPEDMELPLEVICADDYGLSSLHLHYYVDPGKVQSERIESFEERTKETVLTHYWELAPLQLLPGEAVTYFLEVFDNDAVSGPKSARTPLMTVRFPTLAEIYTDMEEGHEEDIVTLEEILEETEMLRSELEEVARELKQGSEVSWEQAKQMEKFWTSHSELTQDIEEVKQTLEESVQKLESYDPLSWELAEKILEVRQLLEELESPELRSAIERLQEALAEMDLSEMESALADYALSHEELLKGLDRAIELLKQIRFDERLQAALEQAMDLAATEAEVDRALCEEGAGLSEIAEQQERLRETLEQLKDELAELAEEAGEEESADMLQKMSKTLGEGELSEMISQSIAMMRTGRTQTLRRLVRDIEGQLLGLADALASAQACSASGTLADVTEKVRRAMHELLMLSDAQEELAMSTGRESFDDLAVRQNAIHEGTSVVAERLFETSKETFFMTHRTAAELGRALRKMKEALRNFEARRTGQGIQDSRVAYQRLNSVLQALLVTEQSMCAAQGGMGLGQGFRRMRSLTGLQRSITRTTEALYSRLDREGRLSHSDEETLGRMAAQQEMVRKGMEEVSRALGERRDILGRLEDIIDEMRSVETSMGARQLDESTIRKQHTILSRLLDAQKSIQQRDYSGKRYSRPGRDFPERASPAEISRELLGDTERMKLDILRERGTSYPEVYRELVEQYLKALSESTEK